METEKKNLTFFFNRLGRITPIKSLKLDTLLLSNPPIQEGLDSSKPKWEVFAPAEWPRYGTGDFAVVEHDSCFYVARYVIHEDLFSLERDIVRATVRELSIRRLAKNGDMTASISIVIAPWFKDEQRRYADEFEGYFLSSVKNEPIKWPTWLPKIVLEDPEVQKVIKLVRSI